MKTNYSQLKFSLLSKKENKYKLIDVYQNRYPNDVFDQMIVVSLEGNLDIHFLIDLLKILILLVETENELFVLLLIFDHQDHLLVYIDHQ